MWKLYQIWISGSTNSFIGKCSLMYCPWLLCAAKAELSGCDGNHMAHKALTIHYLTGPAAGCHQTNLESSFLLYSVPNFWRLLSPPLRGWNLVLHQIPGVSNLNSFPMTPYRVLSVLCLHLVCSSWAASHLLPSKPSPFLTPLRVPRSPTRIASLLCQMFPQVNSMEHQSRGTALEKRKLQTLPLWVTIYASGMLKALRSLAVKTPVSLCLTQPFPDILTTNPFCLQNTCWLPASRTVPGFQHLLKVWKMTTFHRTRNP